MSTLKGNKTGFTVKLAVVISVLLLAANLLLGAILINNSRTAMKTLISERMLDIAKTAAKMLNGDDLAALTVKDTETPQFKALSDSLKLFQDNIELKYIYCVRDNGGGNFTFTIDIEDPALFGETVVPTEGLYEAGQGKAAVNKEPYTDRWGRFYSAYCPVFDSNRKVASIVAVDFDADWYDAQISKQTKAIVMHTVITILLCVFLLFAATAKMRKKLRNIMDDLSDVAKDVDAITREINPDSPKKTIFDDEAADNLHGLGKRIHQVRAGLHQYAVKLHSQANSMITALSSDYRSVYYIDLDKDEGVCYQPHSQISHGLQHGEKFRYMETMKRYAQDFVAEKYREAFLRFVDPGSVRKGLEHERIITYRYMINRGGQETYEMVRMAGVRHPEDRDDHVVHAVGMGFTDVDADTRRTLHHSMALSNALSAAEGASKAKTAFLSHMSHEIRTPMNAIIGLDKIALNDPDISAKTREYLEKIGASADHLLKIINDILDMSRIEAGRMVLRSSVFSLPALIDQVSVMIGGQCHEKGLVWRCEMIGEAGERYVGDDMKLKQIFINILGNSVKFTPEGGEVRFSVERVNQYEGKSVFRFVMSDTGIGMSEEYLPKLFEPFSQEKLSGKIKYGSTGLGMSITKAMIDMMNGEIKVESKRGEGSKFTLTLTLADSEQAEEESGAAGAEIKNVLVVDDDPVACEYARLELEKVGISSESVLSGTEALEKVRLRQARGEAYSLILVDWKMPDIDGLELSKQLRELIGSESAIVILTSFQSEDVFEKADKADIDGFMAKPLQANSFLQNYRQYFNAKAKDGEKKADLTGRRVLLAEDVSVNAEIVEMLLEMREVKMEHAENGRIAVEMFSSHPEGYYDAILMDMRMPEMDGLEATRAVRALDRADAKKIPIVAITANAFDEDVQRSLQAGLNAHLAKPIEPDNLYKTLETVIKP